MKWFEIPAELIPKLRQLQIPHLSDEIVSSEDAVLMDGGMGDPLYLTFDGRVIILDWMDESPPREAKSLCEAATAIVSGAKKRNCPELLQLLPSRPVNTEDCTDCDKSG